MEAYKEYWHPKFYIVKKLVEILYDIEVCGGCCHIVTDEDNIYDDDLDWTISYCESKENEGRIDRELSHTICKILKQMNFTQRAVLFEIMNSPDACDIDLNVDRKCLKDTVDLALMFCKLSIEDIHKKYDHRSQ